MKRNLTILFTLIAFALAGVALSVATTATATNPNNAKNHVPICHATGSESNPFVRISPDAEGVISGHVEHQDVNDIIPPFDYYNDAGVIVHFDGQNWNIAGQAIYFNDCNAAEVTTTTTPTTPETTPTQTVTVTTPGPTVNVPTPGPSTTVTVTTPGPTTTVTTPTGTVVKKHLTKTAIRKVHIKTAAHKTPKTTG